MSHVCSRLHTPPMACACVHVHVHAHVHAHVHVHVACACACGMCMCMRMCTCMCMCPGESPRLCEAAVVCVAAHRGGHGQPPLQLSVLGLMIGHLLERPHAAVLAALVPRFSGMAILRTTPANQLSEAERRRRYQAADLAACNAVRQRLHATQPAQLPQPHAVRAPAP